MQLSSPRSSMISAVVGLGAFRSAPATITSGPASRAQRTQRRIEREIAVAVHHNQRRVHQLESHPDVERRLVEGPGGLLGVPRESLRPRQESPEASAISASRCRRPPARPNAERTDEVSRRGDPAGVHERADQVDQDVAATPRRRCGARPDRRPAPLTLVDHLLRHGDEDIVRRPCSEQVSGLPERSRSPARRRLAPHVEVIDG